MRRVAIGLVVVIAGAILLAWGTLSTPSLTCGDYSADTLDCIKGAAPDLSVIAGWVLAGIGVMILITAVVRQHRLSRDRPLRS